MQRPNAKNASCIKSLNAVDTFFKSGNCIKLKGQTKCKIAIANSRIPPVTSKILEIFLSSLFSLFNY